MASEMRCVAGKDWIYSSDGGIVEHSSPCLKLHMFILMICCPYCVLKLNYKYKHSDGSPVLGCELNAYCHGRRSIFSTSTHLNISGTHTDCIRCVSQSLFLDIK